MYEVNDSELNKDHPNVHVGLVHWPVFDRAGSTVATNVTNFDIHDIARVCRTYGVRSYYIINKMQEQLMFVERILDHWKTGYGAKYNPMRSTALHRIKTVSTIEHAIEDIDGTPLVIATAARELGHLSNVGFREMREKLKKDPEQPVFIVFGTGFGLHDKALEACDVLLEPIAGGAKDEYKHLSVRSAVSICLDRLMSKW